MIYILMLAALFLFTARVIYVIRSNKCQRFSKPCARTLIILGSGGHTSEMARHLINLNPNLYQPRLYLIASCDSISRSKVKIIESKFKEVSDTTYFTKKIPRSRKIAQSYITAVLTTIYSTIACIPLVLSFKPDLILSNGPGTCVPVCTIGFLMKVLCLSSTKIVFIESICRVKSLSLSGKILLRFADKVLVQWSQLQKKYPQTEYIGRLV